MKSVSRRNGLIYFSASLVSFLLYFNASRLPGIQSATIPYYVLLFFLVVIPYTGLVIFVRKNPIHPGWIFLGAVLFRLTLLLSTSLLSDDVYRYIWDGHLTNAGVSPYLFSVNDPNLDGLEISERLLVNHNWMASPYLMTAQGYFSLVTKLFPQSVIAFRVSTVLLDLLTAVIIYKILILLKRSSSLVLIYAWHPLIIFESALGLHVDFLMVFLIMVSLYYLLRSQLKNQQRTRLLNFSAMWFTAAALTKGWPLLFLPVLLWWWGWRRSLLVLGAVLAGILVFVPTAGLGLFGVMDGTGVLGAIRIYVQYWQFNGSLVTLLTVLVSRLPIVWLSRMPDEKLLQIIRVGLMILFGGLLGWISVAFNQKIRQNIRPYPFFYATVHALMIIYGIFLLFSATVHPWYLVLVVPFLTILPGKPLLSPWYYFSLTVVLSYLFYVQPDRKWILWAEYLPVYALLILTIIRRRFSFEFLE